MSNNNTAKISSIVSKVWAFCNTLRDDGVGYGEWLHKDQTHFNSAMVQLKVAVFFNALLTIIHFNSAMVQLKAR